MRVVFVNRIAWPDEGATALYLTDVAEAAAAAGHEVHVLCGEASYRPGSDLGRRPPATRRGVRYHRVPGRRGRGTLDRALASAAFLARAGWRLLRLPRPDVLVALTDPPFVDVVASAVARLRGARMVHWLMDVYPDVAVAAGVLRSRSITHRVLSAVMGAALRRATAVVVLGPRMRRALLERGVSRRRIRVIANWAPAEVEEASRRPPPPRPDRPLTLMYSGNYGVAHDLSPLLERLRLLPSGSPVRLILQVTGARVPELRHAVAELPVAVEWRQPVPLCDLATSLLQADVHVVSVRSGFERLVVPSKVYAPLALGCRVLPIGSLSRPRRYTVVEDRAHDGGGRATPAPTPLEAALAAVSGESGVWIGRADTGRRASLDAWTAALGTAVTGA